MAYGRSYAEADEAAARTERRAVRVSCIVWVCVVCRKKQRERERGREG